MFTIVCLLLVGSVTLLSPLNHFMLVDLSGLPQKYSFYSGKYLTDRLKSCKEEKKRALKKTLHNFIDENLNLLSFIKLTYILFILFVFGVGCLLM